MAALGKANNQRYFCEGDLLSDSHAAAEVSISLSHRAFWPAAGVLVLAVFSLSSRGGFGRDKPPLEKKLR